MKYDLEQASLLYLGKLLSDDSYYTEELEDSYISLSGAIQEKDKFQKIINEIKEYIESQSPDAGVCGRTILEIIERGIENEKM